MSPPSADPYDRPPSFWTRNADWVWSAAVFALTVVLTVSAFPPQKAPEFAYAFAAPAVFWAYLRPSFKRYLWTIFAAQAVSWTILLGWLHHVTWAGLALLGPFVGAWVGTWFLAVWWTMPRILGRAIPVRLAAALGLAALWVLIEWSRTWLLGGFPWLPLAASQWQRTGVLQIAAYTGAGGVSFVLIAMNVGFAAYMHRLLREGPALERRRRRELLSFDTAPEAAEGGKWGLNRRSQEFMMALFLLLVCMCVFMVEVQPFHPRDIRPLARVAFVQPGIPQEVKWDPAKGPGIVKILEDLTLNAAETHPDLILWPEAVTPWAVKGDPGTKAFVESLASRARAPLLLGSIAVESGAAEKDRWYNAAFVVAPDLGLQTAYYAKRKLVPFGEYVPLRPVLGWLSKFVPIGDDFTPGADSAPLLVNLPAGAVAFGALICYEDTYPQLARHSVLAGADALVVATNNAWFGEEGAATQHAAHSVLRAVETRRAVLRCSNGGWNGWIDEYGAIRFTMTDENGSIYTRGTRTVDIGRDGRWIGRNSFFVEHGDWFILASFLVAIFGFSAVVTGRPRLPEAA